MFLFFYYKYIKDYCQMVRSDGVTKKEIHNLKNKKFKKKKLNILVSKMLSIHMFNYIVYNI